MDTDLRLHRRSFALLGTRFEHSPNVLLVGHAAAARHAGTEHILLVEFGHLVRLVLPLKVFERCKIVPERVLRDATQKPRQLQLSE
jgi:hypothetical protein